MFSLLSNRKPIYMIVTADVIAFALLCFYRKSFDLYIAIAGLMVIALVLASYQIVLKKELGDEYLFLIVSMLTSLGFVMLYRLDRELGFKQVSWFLTGIVLFFLSYYLYIKITIWHRLILYYTVGSFGLFLLTLAIGKNINGSTNWIIIGGYSFQPSEIIKIMFVFILACYFRDSEQVFLKGLHFRINQFGIPPSLIIMAVVYAHMGFLLLQRDWGTALLLFLIYFVLLYTFGKGTRVFMLLNALFALGGGIVGYYYIPHIKVRIDTWLNPWPHIAGKGYQITQSLFAIGSGGFFGTGIGMGRPDLIPEVKTDFIFSAICEEMGIFGGVSVILLYFLLSYRGLKISMTVKDIFSKTVAFGITVMFGIQTFIIIGGVIKLIPLTGITLPFISYGGSSLTTSFIALGILQAASSVSREGGRQKDGKGE